MRQLPHGAAAAYAHGPNPSAHITWESIMNMPRQLAAALLVSAIFVLPATAQELSYKPGTVWNIANIQVEPGQMQRYIDFLAGDWKKQNEFGKKEGYVASYHVFAVNNPRSGEPDLILAIEYKDYYTNAQQLDQQKKLEAFLARDSRKLESESGERKAIRKVAGTVELQELVLK
jgi:hypothetical protein